MTSARAAIEPSRITAGLAACRGCPTRRCAPTAARKYLYGRERPYCQLEKLANLDALPDGLEFTIACFPVRLAGLGAAWTRVVAIIDDP